MPLVRNTISRHPVHGAGIIETDAVPYHARKVTERINAVRKELAAIKKSDLQSDSDKSRKFVEGVCSDLRKAWERLVEEVLLNKSVERFSYGVKTQSLKGVVVNDDDYRQIYFAMEKLSNFTAHDEASGKQGKLPTIDQLAEAVDELDTYRKTTDARRKKTQEERKKLEDPPKASFV